MRNIFRLAFLSPGPGVLKSLFLFSRSGTLEKSPVICRPGPVGWKNHLLPAGPARSEGRAGYGPRARPGPVQTST